MGLRPPRYNALKFTGNKVEFQNGFGAWQRMSYECTYDPVDEVVIDVRVW